MMTIRPSGERGVSHFDWLRSLHTFSFGEYHDPSMMGFRSLRVINEDYVSPAQGFGTHPHRDMEIITYVIDGALEHRDSMGHVSVLKAGEIQAMTAGSGVEHSEYNHSRKDSVHFLQIWIKPSAKNLPPQYAQKGFPVHQTKNRWHTAVSPDGKEGSLLIHQDASILLGYWDKGTKNTYNLGSAHHAWVQIIKGKASINGRRLSDGDGMSVSDEPSLDFDFLLPTEAILFDLN